METTSKQNSSFEHRLSQQLHSLSELSENLTLRILEIEERLSILENSQSVQQTCIADSTQKLLKESEERFNHLKNLLEIHINADESLKLVPDLEDPVLKSPSEVEGLSNESDVQSNLEVNHSELEEENDETQYLEDPQIPLMSA